MRTPESDVYIDYLPSDEAIEGVKAAANAETLIPIVSASDGGIIAYATGMDSALEIVFALRHRRWFAGEYS